MAAIGALQVGPTSEAAISLAKVEGGNLRMGLTAWPHPLFSAGV